MAVREDLVVSAVSFLQDPNVASSPAENKLSFLRSKNLTQEEIDVAFARAGQVSPPPSQAVAPAAQPQQQQPSYAPYPPQPYPWQQPPQTPPEPPKRDWRDWFIMATVVGGVGYGLYFITKRYISPLVSPPTPEKLEQDKSTVDEQFDKAFASLEQLSKDTEALKASETERTEKLDKVLSELESFMRDTKSAGRRQEDETERLRDDLKSLKSQIPKSLSTNKEFTDGRLRDISTEVKSLKSLISQRLASGPTNGTASPGPSAAPSFPPSNNYLRNASGNAAASPSPASPAVDAAPAQENGSGADENVAAAAPAASKQDYISSLGGKSSPFGTGMPAGKAAIPAWQLAASKGTDSPASGSSQPEAGASS